MKKPHAGEGQGCPHITGCALYPQFHLASNLALWQERYCHSDFESCDRYSRAERGERVSPLLLPNGTMLRKPR